MLPETRYARSGDVNIAYQVVGDGPIDLVFVPGFVSHLDLQWGDPRIARFLEKLASFSRLIMFDKRGTGLSDPVAAPARAGGTHGRRARGDGRRRVRARRAFGVSEGGPMSMLFATTYPSGSPRSSCAAPTRPRPLTPMTTPVASDGSTRRPPGLGRRTGARARTLGMFGPERRHRRAASGVGIFERSAASPRMVQTVRHGPRNRRPRPAASDPRADARPPPRRRDRPVEARPLPGRAHPGARLVDLAGVDHMPCYGDAEGYRRGDRRVPHRRAPRARVRSRSSRQ